MTTYNFTTVTDPNGVNGTAVGSINNAGEVVGSYNDPSNNFHGFSEINGTYTSIDYPGADDTSANGVNAAGEIVGQYVVNNTTHGFVDNNGTLTAIDYPNAPNINTSANDVNDSGEIVGGYVGNDGVTHGFIDNAGTYSSFDVPNSTYTDATGVNDSGEIVGFYDDANGNTHGFVDNAGTFTTIDYPGATSTNANEVNASGEIIGYYTDSSGNTHGFIDDKGTFSTIDYPGATATIASGINDAGQISGLANVNGSEIGFVGTPVCFASGTAIRTERGEVAVEHLAVGDVAIAASGARRRIRWLGHRTIECRRHPRPSEAMPVRIAAGAFGPTCPSRDLYLSPGHPVLVGADEDGAGGHLVPIMCLINGTTIARVAVEEVAYWHVELDVHDILLAENLPAESYIDLGSRPWFAGADGALHNPDLALPGQLGRCRPVAVDGPVVEAERRRLDMVFATRLRAPCAWPTAEAEVSF